MEGDGVFTIDVDSLSAAIPLELRSGAATHASKVTLRLDDAEWRPGDVEVTTRLVHIYRACPQLFTVAIDDSLDLPVKLLLAGGAEVASAPPVAGGGSSFVMTGEGIEPPNPFRAKTPVNLAAQAGTNPFSNPLVKPIELPAGPPPLPTSAIASPFIVAPDSRPVDGASAPISPFLAAITGTPAAVPTAPVGLPPFIQPAAVEEPAKNVPEMRLSFPFHLLLAQVDAGVLGINPAALPLDWKTHLPLSFVKPQFAGGRVVASVAKLIEHADPAAKVGLQGVNMEIEVIIPLKEIVRQLPSNEMLPGPTAAAVQEKAIAMTEVNPFLSQAQEEARRGFVPLKEAPPAMLDPTASFVSPFRIAPVEKAVSTPAKPVVNELPKTLDSLDDLDGGNALVLPARALPTQPAPAPQAPIRPSQSNSTQGEARWLRFDGVGFQPAVRDLELRAVFARSEPFTRQLAIDLTAALPGVAGCVLFSTGTGFEILAQSSSAPREVQAIVARMPRMFERIHGLAEDLGFESGETFTLRTSQGVVSFFSHGPICLSVLQEDERGDAGFWEKLMLVARGIAALRE